jgi:hypothetical protein
MAGNNGRAIALRAGTAVPTPHEQDQLKRWQEFQQNKRASDKER